MFCIVGHKFVELIFDCIHSEPFKLVQMQTTNPSGKNEINIVDLCMYLISKWRWFLLSLAVFGGLAWIIYASRPFVYFASATVIIKDPSNKTSTAGLDRYDNFINKVNVSNEILQFRSKKLLRDVIGRVHADVSYKVEDRLRERELYTQSPVTVNFPDALPTRGISLAVTLVDEDSVNVSIPAGKKDNMFGASLNDTLSIGDGLHAIVTRTNYYNSSWKGKTIFVTKTPLESMVAYYKANIGCHK